MVKKATDLHKQLPFNLRYHYENTTTNDRFYKKQLFPNKPLKILKLK